MAEINISTWRLSPNMSVGDPQEYFYSAWPEVALNASSRLRVSPRDGYYDALPSTRAEVACFLSNGKKYAAQPATKAGTLAELKIVKNRAIGAQPAVRARASFDFLNCSNKAGTAGPSVSLGAKCAEMMRQRPIRVDCYPSERPGAKSKDLAGFHFWLAANPSVSLVLNNNAGVALSDASLSEEPETKGLSVFDAIADILTLWGVACPNSAADFMLRRAFSDLNNALQTVWNRAEERDYWTNETLSLTLNDGDSSVTLPNNVQNVTGPCRISGSNRQLTATGTAGELELFSSLYLDGATVAEPVAYHIGRSRQQRNDPAKIVLSVAPPVSGSPVAFLLDVVKEAPRYGIQDLKTRPVIPIPHAYAESLLMPVARYKASGFYLFVGGEQKETIDREFQQAAVAIGLADPLPGKAGDNKEEARA